MNATTQATTPTGEFVQNMIYRRGGLRMSARALAEAVTAKGIPLSRGMVANLENGRRQRIDLDTAVAIAEVLDIDLPYSANRNRKAIESFVTSRLNPTPRIGASDD